MISCGTTIKGARVPRKRGDGEGTLKQKIIDGRKIWWDVGLNGALMEKSAVVLKRFWGALQTFHPSAKRARN